MKRITLLFVWACCMYAYTTHGQTLEIETDDQSTIEARIEYALSSLDLSPVTTHILKDRTPRSVHCFPNLYSNSDVERSETLKPWKDFSENNHGAARQLL